MSKFSCSVIRDLLPLYEDDICSQSSKNMIEEHMNDCMACQEYFLTQKMNRERHSDDTQKSEIAVFQKINHKINIKKEIVLLVLAVVFTFSCIIIEKLDINTMIFAIPTDKVEVTEIYQLKDGSLYFNLHSKRKITSESICLMEASTGEEDTWSITLKSKIWELIESWSYYNAGWVIRMDNGLLKSDETEASDAERLYLTGRGDPILIWESGQELAPAPDYIEEKIADERDVNEENRTNAGKDFDQALFIMQ